MIHRNFYSSYTSDALSSMVHNMRSSLEHEFDRNGSPGDYEAFTGQKRETSRKLKIILEELSWRDRNPGQWERDREQEANAKKRFGW